LVVAFGRAERKRARTGSIVTGFLGSRRRAPGNSRGRPILRTNGRPARLTMTKGIIGASAMQPSYSGGPVPFMTSICKLQAFDDGGELNCFAVRAPF
jgi:hypothetical protein